MQLELIINNPCIESEHLRRMIFGGVDKAVKTIVLPAGLIDAAMNIYSDYSYSSILSYPYGIGDLDIKTHEIIQGSRSGVKIFDSIINEFDVRNLNIKKIVLEFLALKNVVNDYGTDLRLILENRLNSLSKNINVATALANAGLETLVLATGHMPQNMSDGLVNGYKIKEVTDLEVIIYGQRWGKRELEILEKAGGKIARSPYT